jgi:hypothetical protein
MPTLALYYFKASIKAVITIPLKSLSTSKKQPNNLNLSMIKNSIIPFTSLRSELSNFYSVSPL